jgi:hypothetical protein
MAGAGLSGLARDLRSSGNPPASLRPLRKGVLGAWGGGVSFCEVEGMKG